MTLPALLSSQQQLLDRFRYLTEYGDHVLLLHGPSGAGKSTLALAALASSEKFNQALVVLTADIAPITVREQLVRQLVAEPVFDTAAPLTETLMRLLPKEQRVLLVLDQAEFIQDSLMAELLSLVMAEPERRLNVTLVLAAQSELVSRLQNELPQSCWEQILPIEIPRLAADELTQLTRNYRPGLSLASEEIAEVVLANNHSLTPGGVVAWLSQQQNDAVADKAKRWPFVAAGVLSIAVLLVWWTGQDNGAPDPIADSPPIQGEVVLQHAGTDPAQDLAALERILEAKAEAKEAETALKNSEQVTMPALAGEWNAQRDGQEFEPELEPEQMHATSLEQAETGEQLTPGVVHEEAFGAEMVQAESSAEVESIIGLEAAAEIAPSGEHSTVEEQSLLDEPSLVKEPSIGTGAEDETAEQQQPSAPALPKSLTEQALAERPSDSFILQLGVFADLAQLDRFLSEIGAESSLRVYRIEREPKPWYFVTLGGYPTKASARSAIAELPPRLSKLDPYIKPVSSVQRELTEEWAHPQIAAEFDH